MNRLVSAAKKLLSPDSGPFAQFVKYAVVGVLSTMVQAAVFYALACTVLKCLTPNDPMVRFCGMPSVEIDGSTRGLIAAANTAIGFTVANVFCWLMNRRFVFKPGKYKWYAEFALFFSASLFAIAVGLVVQTALIRYAGIATSWAFLMEIISSLAFNFIVRKFVVFKG